MKPGLILVLASLGLFIGGPSSADTSVHAAEAEEKAKAPETSEDSKTSRAPDDSVDRPAVADQHLIVTPTRREEDPFDLPYTVEILEASDLRVRKITRTLIGAFAELPAVLVQKTAYGQGSPYIRGFTGFHTLMMIDGIRLNHSAFRSGPNQYWATVDPLLANRLELVKGPGSVLYGSDAVGGTVNLLTEPALAEGSGWSVSPGFYYRYSSAGDAHVGAFDVQAGDGKRFGVRGGLSIKRFDDVVAGDGMGLQPFTGYDEQGGHLKVEYRPTADSSLVFAYQQFQQDDVPRTHKTVHARSFRGTTLGSERRRDTDQERDLAYVQYRTAGWGVVDAATFSVSLQRHREERDRLKAEGKGGDLSGFDLDTVGVWAQFESRSPIGKLLYGLEFYRDRVDSFKTEFDDDGNVAGVGIQGPVADDARYDLLGFFVQDDLQLSQRLGLNAGLRYTYAAVDAGRVDVGGEETAIVDDWDNVVGNLRFTYRFGEHWQAFAALSQGFRAPGLGDLSKLDDTSAVEVPSPDLEPEEFTSFEVGAKTRYRRLIGQYAYWCTWIDDSIVQSPTGELVDGTPVVRKDNIGDGYVQGVELSARYLAGGPWTVFGNFTWMEGEVDQFDAGADFDLVRAPLSRVMPVTANLGVRFQRKRYWVEGLMTAVGTQDDLALRDLTDTSRIPPGGTPGYTVFIVRGGVALRDDLELGGAIQNITDENYRVHGSGSNEPGLNVVLAVNARF